MKRDAWKVLGPLTALAGLAALFTASAAGCAVILGIEEVQEGAGGTGGAATATTTSTGQGGAGGETTGQGGQGDGGGQGGMTNGQGGGGAGGAPPLGSSCAAPISLEFDQNGLPTTFIDMADATQAVIYGSTSGKSNTSVSLSTTCMQADGPERIYAIKNDFGGILTATLSSGATMFDSVLSARTDCMDSSTAVLCADRHDDAMVYKGGEVVSFPMTKGQTIYLVVDGRGQGDQGDYKLTINVRGGATCGTTIPITIEQGSPMVLKGLVAKSTWDGSDTQGSCPLAIGSGDEIIYRIAKSTLSSIDFKLGQNTPFDSVLYARLSCNATPDLDCKDSNGTGESISLSQSQLPAFVVVDSKSGSAGGAFELTVTPH